MARSGQTRLSQARAAAGISQDEMAEQTGISLRTYQRLESGRVDNPPLRYLVNCALALGLELSEILEPRWLKWKTLSESAAAPRKLTRDQKQNLEKWRSKPHPAWITLETARIGLRKGQISSARRLLRQAEHELQPDDPRYDRLLEAISRARAEISAGHGPDRGAAVLNAALRGDPLPD